MAEFKTSRFVAWLFSGVLLWAIAQQVTIVIPVDRVWLPNEAIILGGSIVGIFGYIHLLVTNGGPIKTILLLCIIGFCLGGYFGFTTSVFINPFYGARLGLRLGNGLVCGFLCGVSSWSLVKLQVKYETRPFIPVFLLLAISIAFFSAIDIAARSF